ncbi:DUF1611 domain-containing protein [Pseudaestuariivita rosea]|uniref:nucleotide-binding protein n=1 Tax=Pseudaestuariivita rosea TaxID=2763263 RepID=UPI001ABB57DE|nr:DUF1611 domain-containing protein [Pseudaestuariivita rosea]
MFDLSTLQTDLAQAKWAFTTRRVVRSDISGLTNAIDMARSGDLLLAETQQIGQHRRIQLTTGRYTENYPGAHVVLTVGSRYAPDQFEGVAELDPDGSDLMASGGVLGRVITANHRMKSPTKLRPIGLLTNRQGDVVNLKDYALPHQTVPDDVTIIAVFGTSMNSGKTTTAVSLAQGLKRAGYNVAGIKATGTGAFGDYNAFEDVGVPVLDFVDAGANSTYLMSMDQVYKSFETLVGAAAANGAQIVVVEFADGVFQRETSAVLAQPRFCDRFDGVLFAAPDALSAVGGVSVLRNHGIEPLAVSGPITVSPLAVAEAKAVIGVSAVSRDELRMPQNADALVAHCLRPKARYRHAA